MKNFIRNIFRENIIRLAGRGLWPFWSDEKYLRELWKSRMGRELNLNNPTSFNEKLQWLKLYDRKPEYTMMADKYKVRSLIAEKLGSEYLIPLLGVWNTPDEINFDQLPKQFVLKCNHNSGGGMCICKDKSLLNITDTKRELQKGLSDNYFCHSREWPYKEIKRKIIGEKYMIDEETKSDGLTDYKFYCFNGCPQFLYVSENLDNHEMAKISYLTLDWEFAHYERSDYNSYTSLPKKPEHYEEMIRIAKKLSEGTYFIRVDLYEINRQVYFSELTFYPGAGFIEHKSISDDIEMGTLLSLPIEQPV